MDDKYTDAQLLKEQYFLNQGNTLQENRRFYKSQGIKKTSNILDNILETKEFYKLKCVMTTERILKTLIPKGILNMVIFSYYKDCRLLIKVKHPVAQSELNHKKDDLMSICKKIPEFHDIMMISIIREDKLNSFSKEYDNAFYQQNHPEAIKRKQEELKKQEIYFFPERSVGIFENQLNNKKLRDKMEKIRDLIKNNGR